MHGFTFANTKKWSKKWPKVSYYLVFLFSLNTSKHILLWDLLNHALSDSQSPPHTPTHSYSLLPTPTHSYSLISTSIYSHQLPLIPIHSHLLPSTPTHSYPIALTPTHFHSFLTHSHSFSATSTQPLMFSLLLLILNPPQLMCSLSHPFPVHIQILSPNPTHHLQFQPIFSPCVLCAYISFNVSLFFLMFSDLSRKQLITLGLTTTFAHFQEIFCSLKILIQWGKYINVQRIFSRHVVKSLHAENYVVFTSSINNYVLIFSFWKYRKASRVFTVSGKASLLRSGVYNKNSN